MAKKLSEKSAAVVDLVAKWRALPQELRQNKSLASLARANGFAPNSYFYDLANGPEVYHQMLIEVAGKAVGKAPEILDVLAEHAQRGHAKSAEIYLNFVRQTITDERLIAQLKPRAQLIETLEDVAKVGETFLALADSLPTPEDAEAFVSSMGNDAVDAEWSEAPRNDKVPSDSVPEVPSLPGVAEAAGGDPPPRGCLTPTKTPHRTRSRPPEPSPKHRTTTQ